MFFTKQFPKISEYITSITNRYLAYLNMPFKQGAINPPKRHNENKRRNTKKSTKKKNTLKLENKL